MINVKSVFDCLSGNSGIIEEFIYNNIDKSREQYYVLSSSTISETNMGMIPKCKTSKGTLLKVFENKPGILVARNGRAGKMKFLEPGKYTINDHAYILSIKDKFRITNNITNLEEEELYLKYFMYKYQYEVYNYSTKNDNSTWSKTAFFKNCKIELPSLSFMESFVKRFELCNEKIDNINIIKNELNQLSKKVLVLDDIEHDGHVNLNEVLGYKSRNDSLSEEGIYNLSPEIKDEKTVNVLSGSTKKLFYGKISANSPKIHKLEDQGLHVISRGKAGKITYVPKGIHATNTNAFVFYLKNNKHYRFDEFNDHEKMIYLKLLKIYLQPIFYELSSKSDLGVFPLTEMMNTLVIPKFKFNKRLAEIVEKYDVFEKYREEIEKAEDKLDLLLDKQLAFH